MFTYIVGLGIALLLKQINLKDKGQVGLIVFVSIVFFSITILLILHFRRHLSNIKSEIKKLKL